VLLSNLVAISCLNFVLTQAPEDPPTTPSIGLTAGYQPAFPSERMALSDILREAVTANLDLQINNVDIEISETQVLSATGAFDVYFLAGVDASIAETPRRGSQFAINVGTRSVGGNVGFRRALETGGSIQLLIEANRVINDQVNFFAGSSSASTQLSFYAIRPTLQVTHPLLRGLGLNVNRANIERAKIATTQTEAERQVLAQNLARDLIAAYWDVLFAHRDLLNKHHSVELARQQLERTQALVSAGRLSPVDAKAVEQGLAVREGDVIRAENTLLDRSLALRTLVGQQVLGRTVFGVLPTTDPVVVPRQIDIASEVDKALRANPQIRVLELSMATFRVDELVAANGRLPQLDFTGSFTPQGRSVDTAPDPATGQPGSSGSWAEAFRYAFSEDPLEEGLLADWTLTGSLSLTWDIQNRTPRAAHQTAKLQIRRTELQLEQLKQQIASAVIAAAYAVRTAAKLLDVSDVSVDLAKDNLAAEEARFAVGRSTNFDVLLRLDELDSATSTALSARVGYLKALVQLQNLTGEILTAFGLA